MGEHAPPRTHPLSLYPSFLSTSEVLGAHETKSPARAGAGPAHFYVPLGCWQRAGAQNCLRPGLEARWATSSGAGGAGPAPACRAWLSHADTHAGHTS